MVQAASGGQDSSPQLLRPHQASRRRWQVLPQGSGAALRLEHQHGRRNEIPLPVRTHSPGVRLNENIAAHTLLKYEYTIHICNRNMRYAPVSLSLSDGRGSAGSR